MSNRAITIVLRAKNAMAAGLSQAGEQLQEFGSSALRIGKLFVGAFLAAGTAIAGFAAKALKSMSAQESSTQALRSAFSAMGDDVDSNVASVQRFANAMQKTTGISNEALEMRAAELRQLGVLPQHLEAAVKATVALGQAGMSEAAATRAVAAAREGDFSQLTRYIPQLRTATDQAERAAIVNDFLSRKYSEAEDQTQTLSGQYRVMKEAMADAWKEAGNAIAQSGIMQKVMDKVTSAVERLSARIADWVQSGGVANLQATFAHAFETIRHGFMRSSNTANIAFAAIGDGFATVGQYLGNVGKAMIDGIVNQFKAMGKVVIATFEFIRKPSREGFRAIGDAAVAAAKATVDAHVNMAKAIATNTGIVSKRTEAALEARGKLEQEHADRVAAINQAHTDRLIAMHADRVDKHVEGLEVINEAEIARTRQQEELEKRKQDAIKRTAELEAELAKQQKADREKDLQGEIAGLEKQQAEHRALAQRRVDDLINEQRQARDIEKDKAKEARRAEELEGRIARGAKLTRKDQEFLDAFRRIDAAKGELDPIQQQLDVARDNLQQLQDNNRTQADILRELQEAHRDQREMNKNLEALLAMA
jgi:chromosome segregation ATPase